MGSMNDPVAASIQDRPPNFRSDDGRLYLVRCFACTPERGKENYALNVSSGVCTWCGWTELLPAPSVSGSPASASPSRRTASNGPRDG